MKKLLIVFPLVWLITFLFLHILHYIGVKEFGLQIEYWYVGICMWIGMIYQNLYNFILDKIK
jgi:hypothetical protein